MSKNVKPKFKIGDRVFVVESVTVPMVMDYKSDQIWEAVQEPVDATTLGPGKILNIHVATSWSNLPKFGYDIETNHGSFYVEEEFLRLDVIGYVKEKKSNDF